VFGLELADLGDELLELGAAPVDSVDLLANERLQSVGWAVLLGDPSTSNIARLDSSGVRVALSSSLLVVFLFSLEAFAVCSANEFGFGALESHGSLVTPVDEVVELFGIAGNPNALDGVTKRPAKNGLVQVIVRNGGEEDSPGGETTGVQRGEKVGLAEIDVEDALASNHEEHKTVEDVSTCNVSKVAVVVVCNVGHVENVKLRLITSTGGIDWKENGPGYDHTDDAGDDGHLKKAEEEVAIESVVVQDVCVRESEELAEPVEAAAGETWSSFSTWSSVTMS